MIKNRPLDHIGLACGNADENIKWYEETLGFETVGKFMHNGRYVYFIESHGTVYEVYTDENLPADAKGKIDHISFISNDIEADYDYCLKQGYTVCTDGIEGIEAFWEKGVRFFKILSPMGEQVEFCQKL